MVKNQNPAAPATPGAESILPPAALRAGQDSSTIGATAPFVLPYTVPVVVTVGTDKSAPAGQRFIRKAWTLTIGQRSPEWLAAWLAAGIANVAADSVASAAKESGKEGRALIDYKASQLDSFFAALNNGTMPGRQPKASDSKDAPKTLRRTFFTVLRGIVLDSLDDDSVLESMTESDMLASLVESDSIAAFRKRAARIAKMDFASVAPASIDSALESYLRPVMGE